ncbi:MAG: 30S ribosome-binding factor RbfA [Acidimicrobiia bacterium]|nr:30S ribosome-binding factor RbfA [bacterium]MXW59969.1 30S ribosome-binding factor RbfA [Acidimicrobiia bacterium]MXZ77442.1 30S ribosome-binding factor RbfA [Acidimicrobiia bacterium]MXZ84425.1 30S ribosome-binding factor RbfA [Acidimicrobiia bacterium]MYB10836.1 30S ribosome-binding factor RbfA [Acidimicrobiia bacterium]
MARSRSSRPVRYSRSARLGELLREIVASELAQLDDDRLALTSVTGVETSVELSRATVYISALDDDAATQALEALEEHRYQLKQAVARAAAVRRVPDLSFALDPSISAGERVDQILRNLADEAEE